MADDDLITPLRVTARVVIRSMCRESQWLGLDVDDLVGVGWLAFHAALARADTSKGSPRAYARTCAEWAMRDAVDRWHGGKRGRLLLVQYEHTPEIAAPDATDVEDGDECLADVTRADALSLLARLSPVRRAVLESIYFDHRSIAETAAHLAVTRAVVYKARYRGLQQLQAWAGRATAAMQRARASESAWRAANPERMRAAHARYNQKRGRTAALAA
jgi:RNA polymerase sigma factor (sigma-70 family)